MWEGDRRGGRACERPEASVSLRLATAGGVDWWISKYYAV
jgi:hypothetical protein